jgi:hypothetical protein
MQETGRSALTGGRVPLLWPGVIATAVLWLLATLAGAGVRLGSPVSTVAMGITCVGLALAWGYLIAGATAGGWPAKLVVGLALLLMIYPSWKSMVQGYSGIVLLLGLIAFLAWRWRRPQDDPALDLLVTGVLFLFLYGVIAERTTMIGALKGGGQLFGLALALQTIFLSYLNSALLILIGSSVGDAGVRLTRIAAGFLQRLPAAALAGVVVLFALGKAGWDLSRYRGPGWLTALIVAALAAAWIRVVRPRGDMPVRLPLLILVLAAPFVIVNNFVKGFTPQQVMMLSLYASGLAGLIAGAICLALKRRPEALLAGLAGIWILFATSNGQVQVPVPVLSLLARVPKVEGAATDGVLHLAVLGWAGALWFRGRRDPAPYALLLAWVLVFLGFNGLDKVYEHLGANIWPLAIFAGATLYTLWQAVRGALRRQGRQAVAWTGLTLGAALMLFASAYWGQIDQFGPIYAPNYLPYLGYAMFWLAIFLYGMLRSMARLAEDRGDRA